MKRLENFLHEEIRESLAVFFLQLVIIMLIVSIGMRLFIRPLDRLTAILHDLAKGVIGQTTPEMARQDEIGAVAKAVDVLRIHALDRARAHQDLKRYQERLEELVEERTCELRSVNELQEAILQNMQDPLIVLDGDARIVRINSAVTRVLGFKSEDLLGNSLKQVFPNRSYRSLLQEGVTRMEEHLSDRHGKQIPCWISVAAIHPFVDDEQKKQNRSMGAVLVVRDLRERLALELKERENAYQGGMAEMSSAVLHTVGNVLGGLDARIERIRDERESVRDVVRVLHYAVELPPEDRPKRQRILEESGNLLNSGVLETLEQETSGMTEALKHVVEVLRLQRSMNRGGYWNSRFVLKTAVDEVLILQQNEIRKRGIDLRLSLLFQDEKENEVVLPRNPFQQMLINLLKNACEAIDERWQKGLLHLEKGVIDLRIASGETGWFTLEVQDNGIGFDGSDRVNLFRRDYTTKPSGTGQGLHSTANFIQSVGGVIEAVSEGENSGALFRVVLPMNIEDGKQKGGVKRC